MRKGYIFKIRSSMHVNLHWIRINNMHSIEHSPGHPGGIHLFPDSIIINGGYAWDGCSPKFDVFGILIGTPEGSPRNGDFPSTYHASLVHDSMYQHYVALSKLGISRYDMDREFYEQMKAHGTPLYMRSIYYYAVRAFGWIYTMRMARKSRNI